MEDDKKIILKKITRRRLKVYNLKFEGKGYKEIAEITGYSVGHLQSRLAPQGRWFEEYEEWRSQQLEIIKEDVEKKGKQNLENALSVLLLALTGHHRDMGNAIKAAVDILDRFGLKPKQQVEMSTPEDKAESIAKFFEAKSGQLPPGDKKPDETK